ncbi:hypothetical protein QQ045_002369 [Rhodiola kirilowii]
MPSSVPNYHPYYGSMMPYPCQTPPYNTYMPIRNENVSNIGATEFLGFSTQMGLGSMSGADEATPNVEDSTPDRKKSPKWTTDQNLVLLSGWIKYGTDSIVGRNQKSEAYWEIYNYINKILGKWIGTYDNATRVQQSGWSENDVLAKAHELYSSGKNVHFNLMSEWHAVRDQPRYGSQVGGNTGSGSSGSKIAHESDASDSNSVGCTARPMGRDATKKG